MSRNVLPRTKEQIENHKGYVKKQFERLFKPSFRDMVLHASFIEAVAQILKSRGVVLGDFLELNLKDVKNLRDSLLHHVIHDELTQQEIERKIADIFIRIWPIYRSKAFAEFFNSEYDLNLMDLTDQHLEWYRGEPVSDTSGNVVKISPEFIFEEQDQAN